MELDQIYTRKKIRNRVYKRVSRYRNGDVKLKGTSSQWSVHRWRLDEASLDLPILPLGAESTMRPDHASPPLPRPSDDKRRFWNPSEQNAPQIWFPLPSDNLLQLEEFNVLRGLLQNKYMVDYLTVPCQTFSYPASTPGMLWFVSAIWLQMSVNHLSWIDSLPCPVMRENIIRHKFEFSHVDFVKDLVGNLMNLQIFYRPPSIARSGPASIAITSQTGLVVWGEPYLVSSWETTPGFIRKWGWMVKGCYELLSSTNQWRALRGEDPLSSADIFTFEEVRTDE